MKETTGLMVSNKISSIAKKYIKTGKLSQLDKQRLANVGIDPDMLKRIGNNVNKHGENKNGFLLPNTDKWNDPRAVTHFRVALTEDVSRTIVTPGSGDRALLTSTEWGSMIAQYKSFSQSFTQRVLTRGLQEKDSAFVIGVGAMISLGMLVEQIKRKQYGQKALTDFDSLLYAGIERSGVMGWFMDINNIAEKVTGREFSELVNSWVFKPMHMKLPKLGTPRKPLTTKEKDEFKRKYKGIIEPKFIDKL